MIDPRILFLIMVVSFLACDKGIQIDPDIDSEPDSAMYFPSASGSDWQTTSAASLGWDESAIEPLKDYLENSNTKSFMILVNGRIVMEEYFNGHSASSDWEWNSAGKTLVSATTGIAQVEGLLSINDKVSDYLGTGWTNMSPEKEGLITNKNLLSMTSGIDDSKNLVIRSNLTYVADAGDRWAYGNVFQRLMNVIAASSNQDFEDYFNDKLKNRIGMNGYWNNGLIFNIYHSDTRSMARYGLLALNNGVWDTEEIIDGGFFTDCVTTSQSINPSYGYFWWLNGKRSFMLPGSQAMFDGSMIPNAPVDMYAAMGANDQRIYVVPSKDMVVVRMGEPSASGEFSFALSGYDNSLWAKINALVE